ncbi:methyl-accepting chemotaxis protein [Pseudomonas thivervalensis]|uniref:methyl-accepting chemotaxis protein n=1 Tax=Pseudomonas thivervalensis TaxID=86265 RepID=UPI003D96283A
MNLNVSTRLGFGFAFVLALSTSLTWLATSQVTYIKNTLSGINDVNNVKARYAINFRGSVHDRAIVLRDTLLIANDAEIPPELAKIKKLSEDYAASAEKLDQMFASRNDITSEERNALAKIKAIEAKTLPLIGRVVEMRLNDQGPQALELLLTQARPAFVEWLYLINQLIDLEEGMSKQAASQAYAVASEFSLVMWGATIALIVLGGGVAWVLARSFLKPLARALAMAESVAVGNLTSTQDIEGADEPARLLKALERMQQSLRNTINSIYVSADHLSHTSEDMKTLSEQSSAGLNRQNQEIEQAASAVTQMSAAVEEVARNALLASQASGTASSSSKQGREMVVATVNAIQQMIEEVQKTSTQVGELARKSQDIERVLEVIRSIAEQTNLLALNAAIEAARAGDAGRGFAVVADEVRGLAYRTQQSTLEIEEMVAGIRGDIEDSVLLMKGCTLKADGTLDVARSAGGALDEITLAVEQILERNHTIASAMQQQAVVAREVDHNLLNIRDFSVGSREVAAKAFTTTNELNQVVSDLRETMKSFVL